VEALAPSNSPLLNPASAKAAIDTAGLSLVRGGRAMLRDLAAPPRVPQLVDTAPFEVGRTIAVTPGAVVLRTEMLELIHYRPQTDQVREVPLLIVPPTINKYYALDLAPDRSLVEYLVRNGQQVFVISWRNPDARHAAWGLDAYVRAVLDALAAVERVSGSDRTALLGVCAGGIIASITAAYLTSTGDRDRLAAFGLLVTVLDNARAGTATALVDEPLAAAAVAASRRRSYLDGRTLAEVFAWLRPGDLIWNYWVNNYLLGKKPPAFDILFWNSDTARMPATLRPAGDAEPAGDPRRADRARRSGRPVQARCGLLCRRGHRRSPHPVAELLPQRSAARWRQSLPARIADQLTPAELDYLRRVRDFVDGEVLPATSAYWERAEIPWPLIRSLAKLRVVGDGIDGYGCPPMSPIASGLAHMLAEICSMQLYCLRLGRLIEEGKLTDTIAAIAKMNNTRKARQVISEARDLLGGNGILLDFHVIRHMADIEAIHTYEGTETIQTLIVGRDITGVGAFT
jgi:rhodanese-related sulfurtransferase